MKRRRRDADDALEARLGRPPDVAPGGLWDQPSAPTPAPLVSPPQAPPPPLEPAPLTLPPGLEPDDVARALELARELGLELRQDTRGT